MLPSSGQPTVSVAADNELPRFFCRCLKGAQQDGTVYSKGIGERKICSGHRFRKVDGRLSQQHQPDRQLHIPRLDSSFRGESRSMKDTVLMIPNDGASPLEYEGTIPKFGQVQKFSLADRRLDGICPFWAQ